MSSSSSSFTIIHHSSFIIHHSIDQCFDGTCVSTFLDCPQQQDCDALSLEVGISLITCWTGECLAPSACPPLPACPARYPIRCKGGQCVSHPEECPSENTLPSCPLGAILCGTGECLPHCPSVNGCKVNEGQCPSGDCISLVDSDYTGKTDYKQYCPGLSTSGNENSENDENGENGEIGHFVMPVTTLRRTVSVTLSTFYDHEITMIVSDWKTRLRVHIPSGLLSSRIDSIVIIIDHHHY